ncbi:MAG: ABC transporter [Parcubacteria group bacterium CG_4_9_14_0_2_um_filter_35_11]|nr:MAG: ABC transporter [Parcubacteria group bacterium CG_4_9_14_0_2_um_filter_35_11]
MINQFILSLISGIFIGGVAGYLGSLMLSKRMALVAGPLGHLTLPGIALALIYGFDISLGAFPFVILGIVLIWLFEARTKLPMEALTAIVFASGVAIAFFFLPIEQAETALVGDISKIQFKEAIITLILCLFILFLTKKIYPKITLINISEDLATTQKINVKKYNLIYLILIALIVALGVKIVGGLLTAAIVAIPASSARNLAKNLSQYKFLALIFGILSSAFGIFLSKLTFLPAGPLIIVVSAFIFLISAILKK